MADLNTELKDIKDKKNIEEVIDGEVLTKYYQELLPRFENKIYKYGNNLILLDSVYTVTQFFRSYESMMRLISQDAPIQKIIKQLTTLKCINSKDAKFPIDESKRIIDSRGYEIQSLSEGFKSI